LGTREKELRIYRAESVRETACALARLRRERLGARLRRRRGERFGARRSLEELGASHRRRRRELFSFALHRRCTGALSRTLLFIFTEDKEKIRVAKLDIYICRETAFACTSLEIRCKPCVSLACALAPSAHEIRCKALSREREEKRLRRMRSGDTALLFSSHRRRRSTTLVKGLATYGENGISSWYTHQVICCYERPHLSLRRRDETCTESLLSPNLSCHREIR